MLKRSPLGYHIVYVPRRLLPTGADVYLLHWYVQKITTGLARYCQSLTHSDNVNHRPFDIENERLPSAPPPTGEKPATSLGQSKVQVPMPTFMPIPMISRPMTPSDDGRSETPTLERASSHTHRASVHPQHCLPRLQVRNLAVGRVDDPVDEATGHAECVFDVAGGIRWEEGWVG